MNAVTHLPMPVVAETEHALCFACGADSLVGVLHRPHAIDDGRHAGTGIVVIVGGPQYRGGSHRQFVQLSRALAAAGHPVLRFDVRGMGDSSGALRGFEHITADIGAAIDALCREQPQVRKVVLWGLCDAASAALLYLDDTADGRVRGLVLLNPWVRSATSLARTHVKHYYLARLRQSDFWRKLLGGKIAGGALRGLVGNLRLALGGAADKPAQPFQARMARAWNGFDGGILLVLSGSDYTAREFEEYVRADPAWAGAMRRPSVHRHHVPDADHTFSNGAARRDAESTTVQWLAAFAAHGEFTCSE